MTVDTLIEDSRWEAAELEGLAEAAARAALSHLGLAPDSWEISLLGCDDTRIAKLNTEFRGKSTPTNVLSWPGTERAPERPGARPLPPDEDDPELGDIAIAYDTCVREAEAGGVPFADHVTHLLVHGTLHLLGYDHETEADAALMEQEEIEILARLGVPDPY